MMCDAVLIMKQCLGRASMSSEELKFVSCGDFKSHRAEDEVIRGLSYLF